MKLVTGVTRRIGRVLCGVGGEILKRNGIQGTWIDVGAHHGETTLRHADLNPGLRIYALEPDLSAVAKLVGRAPNYFVIPLAVSEKDGSADFYVNAYDGASSLLPFNEVSLRSWIGGDLLKIASVVTVPTIRLDTFMRLMGIQSVDYLKIDTQGMDLAVVKSAGSRLRDIEKIFLEVSVTPVPLYSGAATRSEVIAFLEEAGFLLERAEKQNHDQEENLTFIRRDHSRRLLDGGTSTRAKVELP
jgi:FkbM family methyltransferase